MFFVDDVRLITGCCNAEQMEIKVGGEWYPVCKLPASISCLHNLCKRVTQRKSDGLRRDRGGNIVCKGDNAYGNVGRPLSKNTCRCQKRLFACGINGEIWCFIFQRLYWKWKLSILKVKYVLSKGQRVSFDSLHWRKFHGKVSKQTKKKIKVIQNDEVRKKNKLC